MKGKLTNVDCYYTGGGIYNYSALFNDEVWLFTDFELIGSFDRPYEHVVDPAWGLEVDSEAVEKEPSVPYPTWKEILDSVREQLSLGRSMNVDMGELEEIVRSYHPDLSVRMNEEDKYPAEEIRTYTIGSGEITLSAQDAEELRRILQFEYIEYCVKKIVGADPSFFHFDSERNLPLFARKVAELHDDIVNMEGAYAEFLDESVYHIARCVGVTSADDAEDDKSYKGFWKE